MQGDGGRWRWCLAKFKNKTFKQEEFDAIFPQTQTKHP
jgi:hypothetical protein